MRVMMIVDRYNWAYDSIAQNLVDCNPTDWRIDIEKVKNNRKVIKKKMHKYDFFFVIGWQNYDSIDFLPKDKTITGVHSHHSWDNRLTTPDKDCEPPPELIDNLNGFLGVNAVSKRLANLFRDFGVSKIHYTPNGVNSEMFEPSKKEKKVFYAGYSGTKKHDWRKGTSEIIIPSTEKAKVPCKLAMLKDNSHIPLDEMPQFYQQLSCYLCASLSEGFSLSVLEAASCGVPVISTRVGGCTELIRHEENGFLVDRNIDSFVECIERLKENDGLREAISYNIRKTVLQEYCWEIKSMKWFDFMKECFDA